MTDATSVTCTLCGCEGEGSALLTWSSAKGPRGTTWTCEACTRRHLRAMEAKLDEEHW